MQELRASREAADKEWLRLVKKRVLNSFVYLFCPIVFVIFILGSYDFFRNVESNKCEMTWMFEYPQYVRVSTSNELTKKYPMYGLYAYAEGKHIEPARRAKFTGIPVLFIPGNAGSYKQVRSYASVALRKWLDNNSPYHFDFFSIDFNEEISGVYGYILERQSQYTKAVIEKIMSLYEDHHRVVIIGHSMGGQVAKSINEDHAKVELIYAMATPQSQPLLITDPELDIFYYYVSKNWTKVKNTDEETQLTLVSVAGGERDFFIPEKLTKWPDNAIQTSSKSIPAVWSSTDHLCIVWCKQLVMAVVRSLFDMVEYRKQQKFYAITNNAAARQAVLDYHFIKRSSGKSFHSAHPVETSGLKPPSAEWNELLPHSFCQGTTSKPAYLMFPFITFEHKVKNDPDGFKVLVTTTNTKPKNWIFGCTDQSFENGIRYCSSMVNLSNRTEIIPSFHRRKKIIHLSYSEVKKYSHLIVKMDPVSFKTCVNVEVYEEKARQKVLGDKLTTENAIFYNFTYPVAFNFTRLLAWRLAVQPVAEVDKKVPAKCPGDFNSLGIFRHGNFQTHNFFRNESLLVRFVDTSVNSAHAVLYLDRDCKYSISIQLAYLESAGQMFRTYARIIPSYFVSIILMCLFFQEATGWINFHRVLLGNAYHLCFLPGLAVPFLLLVLPNDNHFMMTAAEFSLFVPIFAYLVAYALVIVISLGAWFAIIWSGNAVHAVIMKFLSKKLGNVPEKVTDLAFSITLERFPFTIAILIVSIAVSTCGAMGLAVGLVIYLIKIFKGYEDILEDLVRGKIKDVSEGLSPINFHMHCAMLWFAVTILNLPSLVFWIHNFKYNEIPQWDLSLYICLMMSPALAILWQGNVPKFHPRLWELQRYLCYGMGIISVVWGTHRIYILSFLIVVVLISLAICQLVSIIMIATETPEEVPEDLFTASQQASSQPETGTVHEPAPEKEIETEVKEPQSEKVPVPVPRSKEDLELSSGEAANDGIYTTSSSEDSE